jgi:release factor glutamine methyltransferase
VKTLLEVLKLSIDYLQQKGIENPRREAEWLLCDALDVQRLQLYTEHDRPLSDSELACCREWLMRRGNGEPLQYIRGHMEFYGCHLTVDRRALIPRQETEWLVDCAVKQLATEDLAGKRLWDLCTGSGCIAIALKHRFPQLHVVGSDLSADALALAAHNAAQNKVDIEWVQGDFLQPMAERPAVDYFICNPPYIGTDESPALAREVRDYEPHLALFGGSDGLVFYRQLADQLAPHLTANATVWLEIGTALGSAVKALFDHTPWKNCQVWRDLAGHDRCVTFTHQMS